MESTVDVFVQIVFTNELVHSYVQISMDRWILLPCELLNIYILWDRLLMRPISTWC